MASILAIDDDQATLDLIKAFVGETHDVLTATDGEAGVELCRTHTPDVLITDIFMPFKDGLEIVREAGSVCPDAKVVVITGQSRTGGESYLRLAEDMGAAATLNKPFTAEQLMAAIAKALA